MAHKMRPLLAALLLVWSSPAQSEPRVQEAPPAGTIPPTPVEKTGDAAAETWQGAGDDAVDVGTEAADSAVEGVRQAGEDARAIGTAVKDLFRGD